MAKHSKQFSLQFLQITVKKINIEQKNLEKSKLNDKIFARLRHSRQSYDVHFKPADRYPANCALSKEADTKTFVAER